MNKNGKIKEKNIQFYLKRDTRMQQGEEVDILINRIRFNHFSSGAFLYYSKSVN
jgi:hypothetical protein